MYTISKEFGFEAGHRLMHHSGKCWNIHGHHYKVEVHVSGERVGPDGMLIDFADFGWVKAWLDQHWDHALILNSGDTDLIEFCKGKGYKIYLVDGEPTAEYMSSYLYGLIEGRIQDQERAVVSRVVVWETPKCKSEYTAV